MEMSVKQQKKWLRGLVQYSLRSLLLLMLFASIIFAWCGPTIYSYYLDWRHPNPNTVDPDLVFNQSSFGSGMPLISSFLVPKMSEIPMDSVTLSSDTFVHDVYFTVPIYVIAIAIVTLLGCIIAGVLAFRKLRG